MEQARRAPRVARFGIFEADLRSAELRRQGLKTKLHGRPFEILALLLERPGEVVTREEFQRTLWPADTFVDFNHGLNNAINKLREALGDAAESPRFVETLPRRGYRFIAPVEILDGAKPAEASKHGPRISRVRLGVAAGVLLLLGLVFWNWPKGTSPATPRVMLVILPFENLSGDPEQQYFSDGLTEEMITQLGQLQPERLGVIARTSSFHYKGTSKSAAEIGQELGVNYLLEGSVRREGEHVRVSAQLIRVGDQSHLWAESYDRELSGILVLQRELARAIANEIRVKISPEQEVLLGRTRAVNPEAHEAYLKGKYHLSKGQLPHFQKGVEFFQEAIERDPNYAPAYVGVASAYIEGNYLGLQPHEAMPRAKAAAEKALALDARQAGAHSALAWIAWMYEWDWQAAERGFQRALELEPGSARTVGQYAFFRATLGHFEVALAEAERARALDPVSLDTNLILGRILHFARQYDRAIEQYQKTLELDPNFHWARFFLGITLGTKGLHKEAIQQIAESNCQAGESGKQFADELLRAYAGSGYSGALRRWAELWSRDLPAGQPRPQAVSLALIYANAGDKERAFEWLKRAFQERSRSLVYLKVDPQLDPLRGDPRFEESLRRMNFPE